MKWEIKATYFFRTIPHTFKPETIKEIAGMGHEIGYHYENLSEISKEERGKRKEEIGISREGKRRQEMGKRKQETGNSREGKRRQGMEERKEGRGV